MGIFWSVGGVEMNQGFANVRIYDAGVGGTPPPPPPGFGGEGWIRALAGRYRKARRHYGRRTQ